MKKIFDIKWLSVIAVALMAMLTSCENDFDMDLPLAVNTNKVTLTKESGSTHVLVYAKGDWKARFTRGVKWASLNKMEGYGNNDIVFTYAANYGVARQVGVIFEKGKLADTVYFNQAGYVTEPSLAFVTPSATLLKSGSTIKAAINSNLRYSVEDIQASVVYYDQDGLANEPVEVVTREGDDTQEPVATPVEPWISNVRIAYNAVRFDVAPNDTELARTADLTIYVDVDGTITKSTLKIAQTLDEPQLALDSQSGSFAGYAQELVQTLTTNLVSYADQLKFEVTYNPELTEEEKGWVSNIKLTEEGLCFNIAKNETEQPRNATINIAFGKEENALTTSYALTQEAYPTSIEFADVRALEPGEIQLTQYIEGYVVSDPDSKNIVSSPQTKQFGFDRTENGRTAYIESLDGKYGFCLKFTDSKENTLVRYARTKIALSGTTLVRKDNPECYTIKGLTADNILEIGTPDSFKVPLKTKSIAELTDDDIFTLVSISNLEIMCKDGAFTNCTDGYSTKDSLNPIGGSTPRWDVAPLLCYDKTGATISMLTNAEVPWRRYSNTHDRDWGSLVPQGSGTFRGIVVADEIAPIRFGDLGRYQLRAMTKEDIDLHDTPFANTIVEWNWNDYKIDLIPEIGAGSINQYGATLGGASDFNNLCCSGKGGSTSEQKGLSNNSGINLTQQWWDFTNNVGKYIDISFSTASLSGSNMIFGIVWGHGSMSNTTLTGPAHWKLLYSTDGGTTFADVPDCPIIKKRSIVWWTTTSQDSTPGYTEHLRKLPNDCFGKEKVILRLQVADTVTDKDPKANSTNYLTAYGCEKANLTPSVTAANSQARIGTITVRYN